MELIIKTTLAVFKINFSKSLLRIKLHPKIAILLGKAPVISTKFRRSISKSTNVIRLSSKKLSPPKNFLPKNYNNSIILSINILLKSNLCPRWPKISTKNSRVAWNNWSARWARVNSHHNSWTNPWYRIRNWIVLAARSKKADRVRNHIKVMGLKTFPVLKRTQREINFCITKVVSSEGIYIIILLFEKHYAFYSLNILI